jgi:hypothetical protein
VQQDKEWVDGNPEAVSPGLYSTAPSMKVPDTLVFKHKGVAYRANADCFKDLPKKAKNNSSRMVLMGSLHGFTSYLRGRQADGFTLESDGLKTVSGLMNPKPGYRARLGFGRTEDLIVFLQYTRWSGEQSYVREISVGTITGTFPGSLVSTSQSIDIGGMFNFKLLPWDAVKTYCQVAIGYFDFDGDFRLPTPWALKAKGNTFEFNLGIGVLIALPIPGLYLDLNLDLSYADVQKLEVYDADFQVLVGQTFEDRQTDFQRLGGNLGLRFQF